MICQINSTGSHFWGIFYSSPHMRYFSYKMKPYNWISTLIKPVQICQELVLFYNNYWYLFGEKMNLSHTRKTRFWYHLEVPFKITTIAPVSFIWELPPTPWTTICLIHAILEIGVIKRGSLLSHHTLTFFKQSTKNGDLISVRHTFLL